MQLDRVQLDAEHVGDPSLAPKDQPDSASWKPHAYQMSVPARSGPQQVSTAHPCNACMHLVTLFLGEERQQAAVFVEVKAVLHQGNQL